MHDAIPQSTFTVHPFRNYVTLCLTTPLRTTRYKQSIFIFSGYFYSSQSSLISTFDLGLLQTHSHLNALKTSYLRCGRLPPVLPAYIESPLSARGRATDSKHQHWGNATFKKRPKSFRLWPTERLCNVCGTQNAS
jgi:hypothetical protein